MQHIENWPVPPQQSCQDDCQISKESGKMKDKILWLQ